MRKHLLFIRYKFLRSLQFRAEIFLWTVLDSVPFIVMFIVFKAMFEQKSMIRTYSSQEIFFYYFVVALIQGLTSVHFEGWRIEEIRMGKIDSYLVRPFSYIKELLFNDIAGKLFYLCLFIPIYSLLFIIAQNFWPFDLPPFHIAQLWIFVMLLIFTYFIELCLATIIVFIGFWFEGSQGLEHFKWISITLFSGAMLPPQFLPNWLQRATEILPFRYMYAVPINILQSRTVLTYTDVINIFIATCLLGFAVWLFYKKAIFSYTSSGG